MNKKKGQANRNNSSSRCLVITDFMSYNKANLLDKKEEKINEVEAKDKDCKNRISKSRLYNLASMKSNI